MEDKLCVTFNERDIAPDEMTLMPHDISKNIIPHPIFSETLSSQTADSIFRKFLKGLERVIHHSQSPPGI
jgi:hypothetical protein